MNVLVTGAAGRLAAAIVQEFRGKHEVTAVGRADLDITGHAAVPAAFAASRPDLVVNCAAYNAVDRAEEEPVRAFEVNAFAVQTLARASEAAGAIFVHYGTDFVFDGRANQPYTEDDRPGPSSVYAMSKLVGEWLARETTRHYVLRVESVFGGPAQGEAARRGSVERIIEALEAGDEVPVFVDRTVSPSHAPDVARATRQLVEGGAAFGLYHCVNDGACRWNELAEEAARILGVPARLKPLTVATLSLPAKRPLYCALSNEKLRAAGITMPHWREALKDYLTRRSSQP
jgi:dTDP-4-dehydrorhamnose reductase